jgi:general secretion pathway protein D
MKTSTYTLAAALLVPVLLVAEARAEAPAEKLIQNVDYRELPLQDALRILSEQTGLNVVATAEARKAIVTLYLRNVTARSAIEELCKTNALAFKTDDKTGIIRISTLQEFQRDLVTVREDKTEVFTLLYPNAVSIAISVRDLFGDRVQLSLSSEGALDESQDLEDRLSRFDIIDQRSQGLGLFGSGSTSFGGSGSGSSSNFSGAGSNRLNTTSTSGLGSGGAIRRQDLVRQNLDARRDRADVEGLTPEQAIALQKSLEGKSEAEIDAALRPFRTRQADITLSVNRKNNLLLVRTNDQHAMDEIRQLVKKLDVPTPMVMLEVKVLSIDLNDGYESIFDYQFSDGVNNAGGFSAGDILPPASDLLNGAARKAAPLSVGGSAVRTGDLMFQYVNESFRARIQNLETRGKITTLATPMLLTSNNEVSRLFVGEERPIIRNISTQTVVNDNTVTSVPNTTVEFRPVGTTLLITPNINSDRTVTLRILQENSTINAQAATIPVVTNGTVQQQNVDVVATRTVSGTVIAKDKLMLAIGGLIEDGVNDQRANVPVLGKIPVLGIPFRRQDTSRNRRELIVLCRPYVISTPADGECISQELLDKLSMHPSAQGAEMKTFTPREVLKPMPPKNQKEAIFRLDHVKNADD